MVVWLIIITSNLKVPQIQEFAKVRGGQKQGRFWVQKEETWLAENFGRAKGAKLVAAPDKQRNWNFQRGTLSVRGVPEFSVVKFKLVNLFEIWNSSILRLIVFVSLFFRFAKFWKGDCSCLFPTASRPWLVLVAFPCEVNVYCENFPGFRRDSDGTQTGPGITYRESLY